MSEVCAAMDVNSLVSFAKACEVAERYDDMVEAVKAMATALKGEKMTVEQRNLFSVAFKNVVGARRASWRVLDSVAKGSQTGSNAPDSAERKCAAEYQVELEEELRRVCSDLLSLVDRPGEETDGKIFFKKMAGDYHRYMAELECRKDPGDRDDTHAQNARGAYDDAYTLASTDDALAPTNPIRLGLALNFSVFYYEIMNDPSRACSMAKQAFDGAIKQLDDLSEDEYKDSTLIMQLIRDNLTLWQSDDANEGVAPEQDGTEVQDLDD